MIRILFVCYIGVHCEKNMQKYEMQIKKIARKCQICSFPGFNLIYLNNMNHDYSHETMCCFCMLCFFINIICIFPSNATSLVLHLHLHLCICINAPCAPCGFTIYLWIFICKRTKWLLYSVHALLMYTLADD